MLLQLLVIAWLFAMVIAGFKPDLPAPPRGAWGTIVVALPLVATMWCALFVLGFTQEFYWIARGTHPNNPTVPVPGSVKEADQFTPAQLMAAGLRGNDSADATLWREQAAIDDIVRAIASSHAP